MYKHLKHIAIFFFLFLLQQQLFGVEGRPVMRRACLNKADSTITLLWYPPTDNCGSFTGFNLYGRWDIAIPYEFMGHYTNFSLNSIQLKLPNFKDWTFYLVYSKACNGTDSIYSDTIIIDNTEPGRSDIDSVSVDFATQKTIIGWKKNKSKDIKGYYIYHTIGANNSVIGNTSNTFASDSDPNRDPAKAPFKYRIAAYDSCNNTSIISPIHTTIFLTTATDQCNKKIILNWTPYSGWDTVLSNSTVLKPYTYNVYVSVNSGSYQFLGNFGSAVSSLTYNFTNFGDQFCFFVRAIKNVTNTTSSSNIVCVSTGSTIPPKNSYIAKISVQNESVELTFITQVGTALQQIKVYKAEDNSSFSLWQIINTTGGTLELIDNQVKIHSKNYRYFFVTEGPCGLIFDSSQICKTILLRLQMNAPGDQDLAWSTYFQFKKNTEKQELLLINTPDANKSSPWNILNTYSPLIINAKDQTNFSSVQEQLCYCVRAIENSPNQFYRRQDTSYSNIECAKADPIVYFPNAIQINGYNTVFYPQGVFLDYTKCSFKIYNRWGQIIYETNDIRIGWDGKISSTEYVEEDVYAYTSIITGINGTQLTFNGTVTVLK